MDPFEIDPMAMIEAQQQRIVTLMNESVQLTAAVMQLRGQIAQRDADEAGNPNIEDLYKMTPKDVPFVGGLIEDVTDEVVGAEITS